MKKLTTFLLVLVFVLSLTGCSEKGDVKRTIHGNLKTYYEMADGTWQCDGISYQYRLEITGRLNHAVRDSTYVYLSNLETISFDQAWKAGGLGSDSKDYFPVEDAVLVEWD